MPPKKRARVDDNVALTPRQFASSMERLLPSSLQVTDGAMEALRLAHSEFLDLVASELASNKEHLEKLLQPRDVKECLNRLGLDELIVEEEPKASTSKGSKKSKKKRFAVSQDMVAEQERLLEQSRLRAVQSQQEKDSKPESK